jgi:hypothetical protein
MTRATEMTPANDNSVATPVPIFKVEYFGGCPKCGLDDGYLNIGRDHWFVCHAHRRKWWVGSNLFSSWREQDDATFEENARLLAGYGEVEPLGQETIVTSIDPEIQRRQFEMLQQRAAFEAEMADTPCPF